MKTTFLILFLSVISFHLFAQEPSDTVKVEDINIEDIDIEDIEIDDVEVDEIDEDVLGQQSKFPWDKFSVGGQLGNLQFGDVTNIGVSPEIVYHATENIAFGVDGVFERSSVKRIWNGYGFVDANYKQNNTGGRVFTRLQPVKTFPIFAQVEYEGLNTQNPYYRYEDGNSVNFLSVEQGLSNVNAGLGFNNGPYFLALMYNFMNNTNKDDFAQLANEDLSSVPYLCPSGNCEGNFRDNYPYNALSFRTGLNVRLGQGGGSRNKKKKSRNKKRRTEEESSN